MIQHMSETGGDIDGRLGLRVRALRVERGLSLEGLARRTEVSRAMLSRIERGESSPTAQLLVRLCAGLGITLSMLFAAAEGPATPLSRRRDQPAWRDPGSGYLRRVVSPAGTGSAVEITDVEFPPGGRVALDRLGLADADQHVWVLDGTLELTVGEEVFCLEEGDCLMMGFDQPIVFHNPTDRAIRYAVVIGRRRVGP